MLKLSKRYSKLYTANIFKLNKVRKAILTYSFLVSTHNKIDLFYFYCDLECLKNLALAIPSKVCKTPQNKSY